MIFSITSKSEVLFGEGASDQIAERVAGFGCKKIICIYDKGVKDAGIINPIAEGITKLGIDIIHFDGVLPDPPDTMINECGELARSEKAELVLGIGGGSSMDTAKAVNILLGNPGTVDLYFGPETPHKPSKPLILVPTTSGTGSEVTFVSVVSNTKAGVKTGIAGPATIASLAVVDPALTRGMPPKITAATGMDAFAHAMEAYTSKANNLMSDALAEKALQLIIKYLPRAYQDGGDMEARTQMSFASLIAGMSFNDAVPHLGHAFGHTLGAFHHIPHGIGCAIAQPAVIDIVSDIMPGKVRRVGELFGLKFKDGLSAADIGAQVGGAIRDFNQQLGIPTLMELDIPGLDLEQLAKVALSDVCYFFIPKEIGYDDMLNAFRKLYSA